ncbi:hypothetical protein [Ectobacillus ponti]|uniref:Uncharacterized protein n=1 Tax=Ectobacillus ponti TaxID=2961894 RepID=A0AA41X6Q8_9BACI|nr:hypothetical protein [Ectobacillus ponti]MCP8969742.1 hypothetical protein [Ectobacillus ponti]
MMEAAAQILALLFDALLAIGNAIANIPGAQDNGILPMKATHADSVYVATKVITCWPVIVIIGAFLLYSRHNNQPAKSRARR